MWQFIKSLDIELFCLINKSGQNGLFDFLMPILSNIKYFYIPLASVWLFLITRKGFRARSLAVGIVLLITFSEYMATDILKPLIGRPRPYDALSHVRLHDSGGGWTITPALEEPRYGHSRSLPSAHATNIFAAALLLTYYYRRWWPAFYAVAFLVAYSRVYLGVHYPLDVFAGAFVGTLCGLLAVWCIRFAGRLIENRKVLRSTGENGSHAMKDET
jgi:undecaprenyl-diphosphatase